MGILNNFKKRKAQISTPVDVVYHGSPKSDIDQLSLDHSGTQHPYPPQEGPGIYLTDSDVGAAYYGNTVYKVQVDQIANIVGEGEALLDESNIMDLINHAFNSGSADKELVLSNWDEDESRATSSLLRSIMSQPDSKQQIQQVWAEMYDAHSSQFAKDVVEVLGVDGIATYNSNTEHTHYTIFNPAVLKILGTVKPPEE